MTPKESGSVSSKPISNPPAEISNVVVYVSGKQWICWWTQDNRNKQLLSHLPQEPPFGSIFSKHFSHKHLIIIQSENLKFNTYGRRETEQFIFWHGCQQIPKGLLYQLLNLEKWKQQSETLLSGVSSIQLWLCMVNNTGWARGSQRSTAQSSIGQQHTRQQQPSARVWLSQKTHSITHTTSHTQIKPLILLGPLTGAHGNKLTTTRANADPDTQKDPLTHTCTCAYARTHAVTHRLLSNMRPIPDNSKIILTTWLNLVALRDQYNCGRINEKRHWPWLGLRAMLPEFKASSKRANNVCNLERKRRRTVRAKLWENEILTTTDLYILMRLN